MFEEAKRSLVEYGRRLLESNMVGGTAGNLSVRVSEELFAITPSGMPYNEIECDDVPILDMTGHVVEGSRKPSIEFRLHLQIYKNFSDVQAIVHAHPIYCGVLSILRLPLPALNETMLMYSVFVPVSEYANSGTEQLARNVVSAMRQSRAVIMANHGLVCAGESLKEAFDMCETIERTAKMYVLALSTGKTIFTIDEKDALEAMEFLRKNYGQRS
ncbi:aldolase [Pseudothermotoga hypogea DSM 11164 = NBRC 106472]|uniref:Aldolase n=1 Tax=Pseudothermotoga hypogea DSM 11164 = NBRC 106472 TaxID=1123384 RepID=A0A0X1KPW2_9THEM|nr:class II aldolase/adducin family protein [Pseudothermotoga hypogea]AJC73250.1 aldolase [Pseudothermotoga hypogea DSM 11164 = NBRC 106472]